MRMRVVDLDGAVAAQAPVQGWLDTVGGDLTFARDLAPRLRLLANRAALRALGERLGPAEPNEIYFYGSGDFHHLSLLLIARLDRPVSIVHFDNHPDWTRWPRSINCGSWVCRALDLPQVERVVTIGPCSPDLLSPQFKGADLAALRAGRLEVHPLASARTFYAGPAFETPGAFATAGTSREGMRWRGVEEGDWLGRIDAIARSLPDTPVWITLDKDVLGADEAITNWDQGRLTLDQVHAAVALIAHRRRVLGMDVCGDYSPDRGSGLVRALLAYGDRTQRPVPAQEPNPINARTNLRILRTMESILQ
ncbi:hypothetical protein [Roseixanthobacter glucoisosaccharinicivorans]|uniref:hypothetical protein n=1 Tax=Roseixanthobacter glucoisosaccharinicivorans TaxID=3119923 RepID=UPI00372C2DB5